MRFSPLVTLVSQRDSTHGRVGNPRGRNGHTRFRGNMGSQYVGPFFFSAVVCSLNGLCQISGLRGGSSFDMGGLRDFGSDSNFRQQFSGSAFPGFFGFVSFVPSRSSPPSSPNASEILRQ